MAIRGDPLQWRHVEAHQIVLLVIVNTAFLNGCQAPSVVDQLLEMLWRTNLPKQLNIVSVIKQNDAT